MKVYLLLDADTCDGGDYIHGVYAEEAAARAELARHEAAEGKYRTCGYYHVDEHEVIE